MDLITLIIIFFTGGLMLTCLIVTFSVKNVKLKTILLSGIEAISVSGMWLALSYEVYFTIAFVVTSWAMPFIALVKDYINERRSRGSIRSKKSKVFKS